jgi:hypothetical protein
VAFKPSQRVEEEAEPVVNLAGTAEDDKEVLGCSTASKPGKKQPLPKSPGSQKFLFASNLTGRYF